MELRPYQSSAIEKLRDRIKQGHKRVVMVLATGGGKTRIAAEIIRLSTEKGKRVCFVCNRIELVKQAAAAFEKLGMKVGILQGMNTYNASAQIVVASIQTIVRRKAQDFDLYIIDECHGTAGSTAYHSLMYRNSNVVFVGLTATPWAKGMARKHKELNNVPLWHPEPVVAATIADLIKEGFLVDADCYAPGKPDLTGVKIVAGDYDQDELAKRSDTTKLVGDIVTHWIRLAEGRQTVIFAVNVAHSRHIVQCFNDRLGEGMAHHIDGYMTEEERRPLIDRFRAGEYPILSNCQMLQEGFDVPATTVVVLAKATRSLISFIQSCGRALRPHGEKKCLARGTEILTDKGLVSIENITLDHKVWDGYNFVNHGGAVCNGYREVIEYCGLIATPDHEVLTNDGWTRFEEAAKGSKRIVVGGIGGLPIWESQDYFSTDGIIQFRPKGSCDVYELWQGSHEQVSQYPEKTEYSGVSSLQSKATCGSSEVAISKGSGSKGSLRECSNERIQKLWRAWNKVFVRFCKSWGIMDCRESRNHAGDLSVRQDRQRFSLYAREYQVGQGLGELPKQQTLCEALDGEIYFIQDEVSGSELRRCNIAQDGAEWDDRSGNSGSFQNSVKQTKREVWDILNAGPLQRFTANGLIVHNCALILDHSGNIERLGWPTETRDYTLNDGKPTEKKEQPENLPKVCPSCAAVYARSLKACPVCKFEPKSMPREQEVEAGELVQLSRKKTNFTMEDKQRIYSALLGHAKLKGYHQGWAWHQFAEMQGHYPANKMDKKEGPMVPEVEGWLKHKAIKWQKSQENFMRRAVIESARP